MKPFSFLHCADLHLGAPFQGLADLPPEVAARLREAPIQALDRIVATAIERRVPPLYADWVDYGPERLRIQNGMSLRHPPGTYRVVLSVAGQKMSSTLTILRDDWWQER